jgi:hypothetical protein
MEWNRGSGPTQPASQPVNHTAATTTRKTKSSSILNLRTASVALLFCITVLILALTMFIVRGGPTSESKFVNTNKMQAVFLNGGQVYFGRISDVNPKFMRVSDIYYLRVNQTVQPDGSAAQNSNQGVSLVKLGCELHGPDDSMVVNQDQVIFWENLKDDGQVAKAVKEYKEKNPNGQKCEQAADTSNSTNTNTPTTTTPTTTTPTTKKP